MKLIQVKEYVEDIDDMYDVIDSAVDNPEDFICGIVGISDAEIRVVDTVSEIALVIPTSLQEWNTDAVAEIISNASAVSIILSEDYVLDLGFEEGEYTVWDFVDGDLESLSYANIKIGYADAILKTKGDIALNPFSKSYWDELTGGSAEFKEPVVFKEPDSNAAGLPQQQAQQQIQQQQQLQKQQQLARAQAQSNSAKLVVRDAIKAAFDDTEPLTTEERSRLDHIYLNLFKHKLKEGNPLEDFKYDIIRVKRTKYTNVYVLKTPNVIYDTVIKKREQITGVFSPQEVFKIEQNYKAIAGVYAIHVNKDTSIMQETQSLMDFYLKRNRFSDEDLRFGDPTKMVIGFSPSGLISMDTTAAGACHILVAGSTGSGKSVTMQMIIAQSIADGALLFYFDPKNSDSAMYRKYGIAIATEPNQMLEYLEKVFTLYKIQKDKVSEFKDIKGYNKRNPDNPLRRIMVCFDEYESFMNMLKGKKDPLHRVDDILTELCAKGRSVGVFVVMGSQTPAAAFFNQSLRMNLQVKLLGTGCGPYFKAYDMDKLPAIPMPPSDNQYLYAGRFTCKNTASQLKSLYLEVGDLSEEFDNKTELDYLMDIFKDQGLLVATQEIIDKIPTGGDGGEEGEDSEGISNEDGYDLLESLSKPVIEDVTEYEEVGDEYEYDGDEDYVSKESSNTKKQSKAFKPKKKSSEEMNTQSELSNTDRYKKDKRLTARQQQIMTEYFDLIDKNTNRLSVPSAEVPLILTGKSAKIPDTTIPKYNMYSSFSFKNKMRAKAVNFIGKFSTNIASKLTNSINLENDVAKKATYIFLHTFSKSRRLDNIKSLALCMNNQAIYINDIPRLLDSDININDSGPFGEKYSNITPDNFYYPHIETLYNLEELMFDSAALAYKAMDAINTIVFGNTGEPGVDILFECQPNLKTVTIYDKVYYRSNKKAKLLLTRKDKDKDNKTGKKDSNPNIISSAAYQDDIDEFYEVQARLKQEEEEALSILSSIREKEISSIEDLPLNSSLHYNGEAAIEDMRDTSLDDVPLDEIPLDEIPLDEIPLDYEDPADIPIDELPLEELELSSISEPNSKDTVSETDNEQSKLDSNTEHEEIDNSAYSVENEGDTATEEEEEENSGRPTVSKEEANIVERKIIKDMSESTKTDIREHNKLVKMSRLKRAMGTPYGASYEIVDGIIRLEYSDLSAKAVIKSNLLVNMNELLDIGEGTPLHISFYIYKDANFCIATNDSTIMMAPIDINYYCLKFIESATKEELKEALLNISYVNKYNIHAFHTDSNVTHALLLYILVNTNKDEEVLVTDNSSLTHLQEIVEEYSNTCKYIVSSEEHPLQQTVNNTATSQLLKEDAKELIKKIAHLPMPNNLKEALLQLATECDALYDFSAIFRSKQILDAQLILNENSNPVEEIPGVLAGLLTRVWTTKDSNRLMKNLIVSKEDRIQ